MRALVMLLMPVGWLPSCLGQAMGLQLPPLQHLALQGLSVLLLAWRAPAGAAGPPVLVAWPLSWVERWLALHACTAWCIHLLTTAPVASSTPCSMHTVFGPATLCGPRDQGSLQTAAERDFAGGTWIAPPAHGSGRGSQRRATMHRRGLGAAGE